MPLLKETIDTSLPVDEAFAFVADFANITAWDPNTVTSERLDPGPVGAGSRYALGVRQRGHVAPMEYRVTTWEPSRRVVLAGEGSNVKAIDDIRFEATPTGTRILYSADIRLTGWMRLATPFAGGTFRKIASEAAAGMQQALDERARAAAR